MSKKPADLGTLLALTKTTQTLLTRYQSSLSPASTSPPPTTGDIPNPLDVIKATTTLLKSHTTTLSLLLLTPPLTPSAIISKLSDVSAGPLSGMVAAASCTTVEGQKGDIGDTMRTEVRAQVRRLLGSWSEVLACVVGMAERRQKEGKNGDDGVTQSEAEKQQVLSATGVVWEACDALIKLCDDGVVGLVVRKAQEYRAVLLDAVEELKEWGEDVEDEDEGGVEGSSDEDEIFGASNKLGKDDKELKALLDTSVKKLKMVGMLYQALIKRRLKTYPASSIAESTAAATNGTATASPSRILDDLMVRLKSIPEMVDDVAGAFYDLDEEEARRTLGKCYSEAKCVAELVRYNWSNADDEFTAWSGKWVSALDTM
ncbi:hypothetical protein BDW02DRAFT_189853 [Decorospora gaudefroyi]|uniref:Cyclin-D1-binding protein 1-like N-terminal domain-containing protein n=1 Tax=Decorospora gaudefroyi TaxID=184978 RepID=A0A6A5KLT0_9PLEO|nr:hypothetical protein BDW02DRAFT_189853 [Decorospora gaudefroyi]